MQILNLYAGIGGNRKLWGNKHKITAVEYDEEYAHIYSKHFKNDRIIIGDAKEYLLNHYKTYDFIWASPPCQSHSRIRHLFHKPIFPKLELYEIILFLQHNAPNRWVVENVRPYYKPLIMPQYVARHAFWANFVIPEYPLENNHIANHDVQLKETVKGFKLEKYKLKRLKREYALNNCVIPKLGKHIFKAMLQARKERTKKCLVSVQ